MAKGFSYERVQVSDDCDIPTTRRNMSAEDGACDCPHGYSHLEPTVSKAKRCKVVLGYIKQKGAAIASALGDQLLGGGGGSGYMQAHMLCFGMVARQNSKTDS